MLVNGLLDVVVDTTAGRLEVENNGAVELSDIFVVVETGSSVVLTPLLPVITTIVVVVVGSISVLVVVSMTTLELVSPLERVVNVSCDVAEIRTGRSAHLLSVSLSVREVWGLIPRLVKLDTVSSTTRYRWSVYSKLCCPSAKPRRWSSPL